MATAREFTMWQDSMVVVFTKDGEVLIARDHIVAVCIENSVGVIHVLTSAGVVYEAIPDEAGAVFRGCRVGDKDVSE